MKIVLVCILIFILAACQNEHIEADNQSVDPELPKVTACPDDVSQCADGSFVGRDQSNSCEFKPCPDELTTSTSTNQQSGIKACTKDLKMCPDGQGVGRNPNDNCEFYPCKTLTDNNKEPLMCTQDVKQCPDGSFVGRDNSKNCAFKPCPEGSNLR